MATERDPKDILYIDNSTLKAVSRCSTEALIRYALGYTTQEEKAPLKSGTAGHEALAVWFKGGTKEEALAKFDEEYKEWAEENVMPDDRLSYSNVYKILDNWFDTHPLDSFSYAFKPDFVEVGFAHPLTDEGDIVLTGRMDAVVFPRQGRGLYVLDNKFTGSIKPAWIKGFMMDSQMSGYNWAAWKLTGEFPSMSYINAIELSKIPSDPTRKCSKHKMYYSECGLLHGKQEQIIVERSVEQIEEWRKTAIHLARKFWDLIKTKKSWELLHKVRMQGMFTGACNFCSLQDFCSTGRRLDMVNTMLVYEPWKPYNYSQGDAPASAKKP